MNKKWWIYFLLVVGVVVPILITLFGYDVKFPQTMWIFGVLFGMGLVWLRQER
jgi:hypothetical protein